VAWSYGLEVETHAGRDALAAMLPSSGICSTPCRNIFHAFDAREPAHPVRRDIAFASSMDGEFS
jgi:hypothetical protein